MSEETIYDQNAGNSKPQQKKNESNKTYNVTTAPKKQENTNENKNNKKKKIGTAAAAGVAGVAGAAIGILTPLQVFPTNSEESAEESGTGNMAPTPSGHYTGHDMDIATGVDDSMTFNEAFAAAREEVGAGGLFVWHGHTYGTYYENEWNAMSPEEKEQYWADVHHTTSQINEDNELANNSLNEEPNTDEPVDVPLITDPDDPNDGNGSSNEGNLPEDPVGGWEQSEGENNVNTASEPEPTAETLFLTEDDVIEEYDLDGDGMIDAAVVDADGNDIPDVILDTTGDGQFDTLIVDPTIEVSAESVQEIDGVCVIGGIEVPEPIDEPIPMNEPALDLNADINNPDVDLLASNITDPDITIDNNMDMGEFV